MKRSICHIFLQDGASCMFSKLRNCYACLKHPAPSSELVQPHNDFNTKWHIHAPVIQLCPLKHTTWAFCLTSSLETEQTSGLCMNVGCAVSKKLHRFQKTLHVTATKPKVKFAFCTRLQKLQMRQPTKQNRCSRLAALAQMQDYLRGVILSNHAPNLAQAKHALLIM